MGIQNRNKKDKGKNSVQINVNITEHTPPKVVKIPTKIVKVPTAKKTKKADRLSTSRERESPGRESPGRESDALSARPVEKLQELANEFSRVKDLAKSRGIPIPTSYSQFSDIRDRASLQSNTELLQERIRQLNKSIVSGGGVSPPEGADEGEVIPFVDPVIPQPQVPQAPVPQNPNMFDQPTVVELPELGEAQQILLEFKAKVKDSSIGDSKKIQDGAADLQNIEQLFGDVDEGSDKDAIQVILNEINTMITNLQVQQANHVADIQKLYNQSDAVYSQTGMPDTQKVTIMKTNLVKMLEIRDFQLTRTSREQVRGYITDLRTRIDLLQIDTGGGDTGGGEQTVEPPGSAERPGAPVSPPPVSDDTSSDEPVDPEPGSQAEGVGDLDDIRKMMRNTDSLAADILNIINQSDLSIGIQQSLKKFVNLYFKNGQGTQAEQMTVKQMVVMFADLGGNATAVDQLRALSQNAPNQKIQGMNKKLWITRTIYNMIAFPNLIDLTDTGEYVHQNVRERIDMLEEYNGFLDDYRLQYPKEYGRTGQRYGIIRRQNDDEITKMKLLSKEANVDIIKENVNDSFVRMDGAPLAEVIAFLTVSRNRQLQQGDSLELKPTPLEMDPQAYQLYINGVADTDEFNGFGNLYTGESDGSDAIAPGGLGDDEFNEEMQPENQPLPGSSSEEESLEDSSADEQPPPAAIATKKLRRQQQLDKWMEDLYFSTNRSDQQSTEIHEQLKQEKINTEKPDWNESMQTETALDTTKGNHPLAIAALHKLSLGDLKGKDIKFYPQPASELPAGALPLYNLLIDDVIVNEGNGDERMKFNKHGDIYRTSDMKGFTSLITYPFRGN